MDKDIIQRNVLFHKLFRGEVIGVSDGKITYKPRNSWLSNEIDKLENSGRINFNIYYFNGEDSTLDENDRMTLSFHIDIPKGGSDAPDVKQRFQEAKKLIYDGGVGGILKEGVYIRNGKWDDFDIVLEQQVSATIKLRGRFLYDLLVSVKMKSVDLHSLEVIQQDEITYDEIKKEVASILDEQYRYHFNERKVITGDSNPIDIEIILDLGNTSFLGVHANDLYERLKEKFNKNINIKIVKGTETLQEVNDEQLYE